MKFIDNNSDLDTVNFISKSLNNDILSKALDHSGLIQKEVQVQGKNGKVFTRKQWVKVGEEPALTQEPTTQEDHSEKRKQIPATPFQITEKTKHLIPIEEMGTEAPDYLKGKIFKGWRNVLVSPDPNADVLAVGKDDMDRPQYVYHPDFIAKKTSEKFKRVRELLEHKEALAEFIDGINDKDTSDCLKLIMSMGLRPGSTRNTKSKVEAIGATTLRGEHIIEQDGKVFLKFIGKKGVSQFHEVLDKGIADMLMLRKSKIKDEEDLFDTNDTKLRNTLKVFGDIKVKDLRTMLATSEAKAFLSDIEPTYTMKEFVKIRNSVGDYVCEKLGNQRSMSLNSYIDPLVFESWSPETYEIWNKNQKPKTTTEVDIDEE